MTKKMLIALTVVMLVITTAFAQPPDTLWTQIFGGSGWDYGYSVQQTPDGGYIIGGHTTSYGAGGQDFYLIKTDPAGDTLWTNIYGGLLTDMGESVLQTVDGYVMAGYTFSGGAGFNDAWLVKTDGSGTLLWERTFGGYADDYSYCVQQTTQDGLILAGNSYSYGMATSDLWLIKTDANGVEEWSQIYGGLEYDEGQYVQQTADGGYIAVGKTDSYGAGNFDVYLVKTDASGIEQWSQTYGGWSIDYGYCVQQTSDLGYIISGSTYSFSISCDVYLIKTDGFGNVQWSRNYGGDQPEESYCVQQTSDGGYIITGYTYAPGTRDLYLLKTDGSGNEQWSQALGGFHVDEGYCVKQTSDGRYIVSGYTQSYGAGESDVWLIRFDSETGIIPADQTRPLSYTLLPAYPNPFNPQTLIRFQMPVAGELQILVYDIQGNIIATLTDGWLAPGSYQVPFNAVNLSSGIYFYHLITGDFTATGKMVLMK